MSQMKTL